MAETTRHSIDASIEKTIVTGMIVSKKFIQEIQPIYKKEYMKSSFSQIVCNWCLKYFQEYNEAPKGHIQDIFDTEKKSIEKEDAAIIEKFLILLSQKYTEEDGINEEYIINKTLQHFKFRELELTNEKITHFLSKNKVEDAEEQLTKYRKIARLASGWYTPFEGKYVREVFDNQENFLLKFPGALGEMIGPIERSWFVSFIGPFKRGKTNWILETAILLLMSGIKVALISLEMKRSNINKRLFKRITAFGDPNKEYFTYPCFDCALNQSGECDDARRTNLEPLADPNGNTPEFSMSLTYKPCTACRGIHGSNYQTAAWFEVYKRPPFIIKNVTRHVRAFEKMFGRNMKVKIYPKFSANVQDIKRDLDILEQIDGFIPDAILIDYADILKPETLSKDKISAIDDTWKTLGRLAGERQCLVITASQATRGAIYKKHMDQADTAEWIGKLAHVDIMISLNQTKEEKRSGLMRVGLIAHRHEDFDENEFCLVLQQLDLGQIELGSERIFDWS